MTNNIPALNQGTSQKSSRYIFAESLFNQAEAAMKETLNAYMWGADYKRLSEKAHNLYWRAYQNISTGVNLSEEDKALQADIREKYNRYFPTNPINN